MTLMIPLGGKSTRYGLNRPKWLLTHPDGAYMIEKAIDCLDPIENFDRIVLVLTEEVIEHFAIDIKALWKGLFNDKPEIKSKTVITTIDGRSRSQLETVARGIKFLQMGGPVMVKDCDNYFEIPPMRLDFQNSVFNHRIDAAGDYRRLQQKCFIKNSSPLEIQGLYEKEVVSDNFAIGGYCFANAADIIKAYEALIHGTERELYMSDAINWLITIGASFSTIQGQAYEDWGTIREWNEYCATYRNIFMDIDGVLVENGSRAFEPKWGDSKPINENVEAVKSLNNGRNKLYLVTARPESYRQVTERQLSELGLRWEALIMGLHHAKRLLVNDHGGPTTPYPSCEAWSVKRNTLQLAEIITGQSVNLD